MTNAIEVSAIRKSYSGRRVVDGVSFNVEPGQVFALLGPNGAGKTTTVEMLEGLRRPDAGQIRVLGAEPFRDSTVRARIGVMPQSPAIHSAMRPMEALKLFASFYPNPMKPSELLERVGLSDAVRTNFRRLSGGQQQRLSLALALVGRPEVAFLDEPTAGMDVHARVDTWKFIAELREAGTAVVLTTHLLDEAERVADKVAIIHNGRLVAQGSPAELKAAARGGIEFETDKAPNLGVLSSKLGLTVTPTGSDSFRVEVDQATSGLIAQLATALAEQDVLIRRLGTGTRTLEQVFVELTRERPVA